MDLMAKRTLLFGSNQRADVLDPALLRPGRFDRRVNITLPERKDREAILKVHFKKKQLMKLLILIIGGKNCWLIWCGSGEYGQ